MTVSAQNIMIAQNNVLKPADVAEYFGKSVKWVYRHSKELGASRIGGSIFFTWEGIEDAIQRGQDVARSRNGKREKDSAKKRVQETVRRQENGRKKP